MIQLLQHNPYHVTSLLQCSEIFHHQRDFNVSGDLLERALFTMGRSLHSTFSSNLASGKARLSFRRPENRELFLCGWRYIKNLAQRGTWRTAAEFAFLLLSLDPFGDPYEISLLLDFLCLKARQTSRLLDLLDHPSLRAKYFDRPNIAFSTAIAHHQLSNPAEAQEYLAKAITKFPWIPGMLSKELNLDLKLPGALWGVFPPDDNPRQQLYAQLYVERNKDLWKEPALTALLRETASTIHSLPRKAPLANSPTDISLSLARHIHLTESPGLIRLIPASITSTHRTHAFDPLIPDDNLPSYDPTPPRPSQPSSEDLARTLAGGNQNAVMAFLRTLLPWFDAAGVGSDDLPPMDPEDAERRETVEMFRRQLRNEGVDVEAMLEEVRRGTGLDPAQFADAIRAEVGEGLAAEAEDNEDDDAAAVRGNNGQENARE